MSSNLDLLFKIRGDAAGGVKAAADTRAAIQQLRAQATSDLKAVQSTSTASLGGVTTSLSQITSSIPLVGRAFSGLSSNLGSVATAGTEAGAGLASMAGPISLAVIGIVGLTTAVIKLHQWLFDLAKGAAEWRGALFDMSQQTGVSVETLNALDISLSKVGGNSQSAAQSLIFFQDKLGDAQEQSSKTREVFDDLNISTDNTEQALRDAFKALAAMPEGFRQTNLAAELFGRRGGKQFLAVLKETNGDIDSAVDKLGDLARVTRDEAKAADDFNDALRDLNILFRGAFGKDAIPAATDAILALTKALKDNESAIRGVGVAVQTLSTVLSVNLSTGLGVLNAFFKSAEEAGKRVAPILRQIADVMERLGLASSKVNEIQVGASIGGLGFIKKGTGQFGGGEIDTREHQELTQREIEQTAALKKAQQELQTESEKRIRFVQDLAEAQKPLRDQLAGVNVETHRYAVEQSILNGILKDGSAAEQEQARRIATKLDNLEKQLKLQNQLKDFLDKQAEQVRTATEGERGQIQIANEFIASLEKEGAVLQESTKQLILRRAAILANTEALKMYKETLEAIQVGGGDESVGDDAIARGAGAAADAAAGLPPPEELENRSQAITAGLDAMREGFAGLADAVSSAIDGFIKFGSAGIGFRKFVTEILSGIARMAAVKAIYHLAEGFAALAFAFFGMPNAGPSAAAHFQAAAIYGAIAGVAAIAGRATAGDSFSQGASSSGGGSGSGGRSSSGTSTDKPQTMEVDRNRYQPITRELVFRVKGDAVVDSFIEDFDLNGRTRIKITGES